MENKVKVCDYLADYLSSLGIEYVHLIFGGGAMPIQDSLCKHPKMKYICYHSEAGASYGAFGFSKYTNKINIVAPTTGIACINAMAGLLSCFNDKVPVLFISGDIPLKQTTYYQKKYNNLKLNQLGIQEFNIIDTVKTMTKFAVFIEKPEDIVYEIQKCVFLCLNGCPGPCWVNIPSDILNSYINPEELRQFNEESYRTKITHLEDLIKLQDKLLPIKEDLLTYRRPLILAGGGIRQSNTVNQFKQFIEKYQIPFVHTYLGLDLMDFNDRLCLGSIGIKGKRNSNFALNNCDLLLVLGCSLNSSHIGYDSSLFAPKAKKIAIDIDNDVHKKDFVKLDKVVNCELRDFFDYVNR